MNRPGTIAFFEDDEDDGNGLPPAPPATGLLNEDGSTFLLNEDGTVLQPE